MILKVKKTSEIVDAAININKDGAVVATYWTKETNQGHGGWVTHKIRNLVPVKVETENEKHSKECQAIIDEQYDMYCKMFDQLDGKDIRSVGIKHRYVASGIIQIDGARFTGDCIATDILDAIKLFRKKTYSVHNIMIMEQVHKDSEVGVIEESVRFYH